MVEWCFCDGCDGMRSARHADDMANRAWSLYGHSHPDRVGGHPSICDCYSETIVSLVKGCSECGEPLLSTRPDVKLCSARCRKRASRKRGI